jgi:diguanylate cyclase (GGDEF)-like protein
MRIRPFRPSLLVRFGVLSALPIVGLGAVLAHDLRHSIRAQAVRDARTLAKLTAGLRIQPQLDRADLRKGLGPARAERLRRTLRTELSRGDVVRTKVWSRRGRVVFSDDRSLVGRTFALSDELEEALGGQVASEVTDLGRAEQARDRRYGKLVEVYVPLRFDPRERPAGAFEIYVPYRAVAARIERATRHTFLLLLGGLAALWAILFPIAAGASNRLRRQAAENRRRALHDALTGLPNRVLFRQLIAHALDNEARGTRVAVLLMDLDRFREVNDTLGHHNGDLLLEEIGARLRDDFPQADTVARLGGDEFGVLLRGVGGAAEAEAVAQELARRLERPFDLDQVRQLHVEASVGIALHPDHGEDADALIQHADVAMYAAKDSRAGIAVYDAARDQYSSDRLALISELRRAIERNELVLHHQPKVDLEGEVAGAEALVRWQHPERGLILPSEFLPAAEHTGLIRPLTRWVLETALRHCATWRREGRDLSVAVNLSAANLADAELPDDVGRLLRRAGLPAHRLTLEITESTAMADPVRARGVLQRLSALGVSLSIDDFGTGHSSLDYLRRLPVDELKIDRSFISDMDGDPNDEVIARSTIELGHNLGLRVVAEGVESEETLAWLSAAGCDLVQGYAVSAPLPADELVSWIRERGAAVSTRAEEGAPA